MTTYDRAVGADVAGRDVWCRMRTRPDHRRLTPDQRRALVEALLTLKDNGAYDRYVAEYRRVFEAGGPARCGPAFLPWHREFVHQFELDLQTVDPRLTLPYWDWTSEGSSLWDRDLLGGGGDGPDGTVTTGPFALDAGRWRCTQTSPPVDPGPALRRWLGAGPALPTPAHVDAVLAQVPYERFVTALEELVRNSVRPWVGRTLSSATAPNDPAFWLVASNIDRLWAAWQDRHPDHAPYLVAGHGPQGHRLDDPLTVGSVTRRPRDLIRHRALGYRYDSDLPADTVVLVVGAPPLRTTAVPGECDHYQFVAAFDGTYTVELEGLTGATLALLGPDDAETVLCERDGADPPTTIAADLPTGSYLVRVSPVQRTNGAYSVAVRGQPRARRPDAIVVDGPAVEGIVEAGRQCAVYAFAATHAATYTIETRGTTEVSTTLFGPDSDAVRVAVDDDSGPSRETCLVVDLQPGIYLVRVRPYRPAGATPFHISVRLGAA